MNRDARRRIRLGMRTSSVVMALACLGFAGCGQLPPITGATYDELLASDSVGDTYRILVRTPPSYESEPTRSYPMVVQLDATSFGPQFDVTAGLASSLENEGLIEEVVVLGVGYPYDDPLIDRTRGRLRDYTTRESEGEPGGAPAFRAFVEKELLPWASERWRIDPERRALFGHSLGGYFALWSWLSASLPPPAGSPSPGPSAFGAFVANDPSITWDDLRLFELEQALSAGALEGQLFLPVARYDGAVQGLYTSEFAERLDRHPGVTAESRRYDTDHGGVVGPGFRDGLVAWLGGEP
jgi:predicted alpha/beta superfamily hydrolase